MNKQEFLAQLRKGLSGLPRSDIEERIAFYGEIIDDRMEEGLSEEEAVSAVGSVDEIVAQIVADIPLTKLVKEKIKPHKSLRVWEIALLVLGSPIWLSLLIALFAVILSLYICLWAVIISLWAVFASLVGCTLGTVAEGVGFIYGGCVLSGIAMIGAGVVCAGLSVFMFCGCKVGTKGIFYFTKKLLIWIKNCIINKEEA